MIRSQLSRVILWNGALSAMPALTISSSIGPLAARASSNARSIAARSVTSHWTAVPPTRLRDQLERLRPAPEQRDLGAGGVRCVAAAAPMPVPPPVIRAWRPSSQFRP